MDHMSYIDMSRDLNTFVNEVVIGKDNCEFITLMGHSMGGKTAMSLVLQNVEKFLNIF